MEIHVHRAPPSNRRSPRPSAPSDKPATEVKDPTKALETDSVELSASNSKARFSSTSIPQAVPGPMGAACALLTRELDPLKADSWDKAEAYYEEVRAIDADIQVIADNTPYNEKQVTTIKDHLFMNTHQLDDGPARFDADPLIANAWSRLSQGESRPGDLQLMEHEFFEARFESLFDTDYRTAHEAANRSGRESGLY